MERSASSRSGGNRSVALTKPQRGRGCTDVPFLVLFIVFWCGMVIVASFSLVQGDALRLVYGVDSFGNTCGRDNMGSRLNLTHAGANLTGRPFLFAMDVSHPFDSLWICVKECPSKSMLTKKQLRKYAETSGVGLCLYDVPFVEYDKKDTNFTQIRPRPLHPGSTLGPCPLLPIGKSIPIVNRCIPESLLHLGISTIRQIFSFLNDVETLEMMLVDLAVVYQEVIALCILAFCIAMVMVFIFRFVARIAVYFIFVLVLLASIGVSGLLWWGFWQLKTKLDAKAVVQEGAMMLRSETVNEHAILIYAIVASIITVMLLVFVCCMWRNVGRTSVLFAEASRALATMPCLLMTPFYTCLIMALLVAFWLLVALSLATAADASFEKRHSWGSQYIESVVVQFNISSPIRYFWWYHLIGGIWTSQFLLAAQEMIVAGAITIWYFSRNKEDIGYPMCISLKRLVLYHLGSIALGSFIITLVKLPRLILIYVQTKLKASKSAIAQYLLTCCVCCLWCVEKCLRYFHHNAYTIIAIEGKSFCPAARQAAGLLASNADTVAVVNSVGDFVLFLGKVAVSALSGIAAFFFLKDRVHFYAVPLLIVVVFAYLIAHCFFSVYEMAIDTLLLCYSEDVDYSDSVEERSRFADDQLEKVLLDLGCAKPNCGYRMTVADQDSGPLFVSAL